MPVIITPRTLSIVILSSKSNPNTCNKIRSFTPVGNVHKIIYDKVGMKEYRFNKEKDYFFLKTIIPSRKYTKKYLKNYKLSTEYEKITEKGF